MVTGIETAGLALAVFPIVVSGLQFYADGARTIKAMWRPEMALKSLIRDIGMEKCKFENTCTFLLEGMVSDSHLILLMDYPGGPLWRDNDLQEKLKSRLRPATAQYYMEAMEALTSTLQSLQVKLGLDKDDKVRQIPHSCYSEIRSPNLDANIMHYRLNWPIEKLSRRN